MRVWEGGAARHRGMFFQCEALRLDAFHPTIQGVRLKLERGGGRGRGQQRTPSAARGHRGNGRGRGRGQGRGRAIMPDVDEHQRGVLALHDVDGVGCDDGGGLGVEESVPPQVDSDGAQSGSDGARPDDIDEEANDILQEGRSLDVAMPDLDGDHFVEALEEELTAMSALELELAVAGGFFPEGEPAPDEISHVVEVEGNSDDGGGDGDGIGDDGSWVNSDLQHYGHSRSGEFVGHSNMSGCSPARDDEVLIVAFVGRQPGGDFRIEGSPNTCEGH